MRAIFKIIFFMTFCLQVNADSITVEVPEMVCQACVQKMKQSFKSFVNDQDKDILVNLKTKTVSINSKKDLSDQEVQKRVKKAGYSVGKILRKKN